MIKIGHIKKIASFYKLAAFLATATDKEVENALRTLQSYIPNDTLVQIFDLWQEAADTSNTKEVQSQAVNNLNQFIDQLLPQYSQDLDNYSFNQIFNSVNVIADDAEERLEEESTEQVFDQEIFDAGESVGYEAGQEMRGQVGGRVTESDEDKKERDRLRTERLRLVLKGLKKRNDYESIKQAVEDGKSNEEIGITDEQYKAIVNDLTKNKNIVSRVRKAKSIKRLMNLGLTRQDAEDKYELLQNSDKEISQEQVQLVLDKYKERGQNLTEEQVRDQLSKLTDEELSKFKKKKVIKLNRTQLSYLSRKRNDYIKKLINQGHAPEEAVNLAKSKFKDFKNSIKYISTEEKNEAIKSFTNDLLAA